MLGKIKKIWKDFDKEILSKDDDKKEEHISSPQFDNQKFDFKGQR